MGELREQGIQFKSLTEPFDTIHHGDELFFHIVAAFARMQRRQSEKARAGLAAAKARGRLGGRPTVLGPDRGRFGENMRADDKLFDDIAALLRVGAASVKRAIRERPPETEAHCS